MIRIPSRRPPRKNRRISKTGSEHPGLPEKPHRPPTASSNKLKPGRRTDRRGGTLGDRGDITRTTPGTKPRSRKARAWKSTCVVRELPPTRDWRPKNVGSRPRRTLRDSPSGGGSRRSPNANSGKPPNPRKRNQNRENVQPGNDQNYRPESAKPRARPSPNANAVEETTRQTNWPLRKRNGARHRHRESAKQSRTCPRVPSANANAAEFLQTFLLIATS